MIGEKLVTVAENVQRVFDAGRAVAEAECSLKHHVAKVVGDGSDTLKFYCPFEPDLIFVSGHHPLGLKKTNAIAGIAYNLRTFGVIAGVSSAYQSGVGITNQAGTIGAARTRCYRTEDGMVTMTGFSGTSTSASGFFVAEMPYYVSAVKYSDMTDKELLDEVINDLDNDAGGTITLFKARVEDVYPDAAAGTNAEWNDLIEPKSAWTIAMYG